MKGVNRSIHLDGLRGLASLMVFFNHLILSLIPSASTLMPDASGLAALVTIGASPLGIIWGGDFGVCIFFALSGYVLSQFCSVTDFSLPAMVIRRYLRLALPMVFSTVLAVVMLAAGLFINKAASEMFSHSAWLALWYQMPPDPWTATKEGLLSAFIKGQSAYNCNLWTMRFELIGSLAIFLLYRLLTEKKLRLFALILASCSLPSYFPLFFIGSLLFELFGTEPTQTNSSRFYPWLELGAITLFAAGIFAGSFPASGSHSGISSPWHRWLLKSGNAQAWHIWGSGLLLLGVLRSKWVAAIFKSAPCQFLGKISFPLYLIQVLMLCSLTSFIMTCLKNTDYLMTALAAAIITIIVTFLLAYWVAIHIDARALKLSRHGGKYIDNFWKHCAPRFSIKQALYRPLMKLYAGKLESYATHCFQKKLFHLAKKALESVAGISFLSAEGYCRLAIICLMNGDEENGAKWLRAAAMADPFYWNSDLDLPRESIAKLPACGEVSTDKILYAGYNLAAMRAYQVGSGALSTALATLALNKQAQIKPHARPSPAVAAFLAQHKLQFEDLQILPSLWVNQIGHLGMLDLMLRMRRLGWWKGTAIILAPKEQVANHFFLSIICEQYQVLIVRDSPQAALYRDFMSLLTSHGLPYHVFQPPTMPSVRWHEAAACAMLGQADNENAWTLTATFDKQFTKDHEINSQFQAALKAWGIKQGNWYVCLYLREFGYHKDTVDVGQANRNSALANYLSAIQFIVSQGGYVIKMGASNSPFPPQIPGLIDYPHSVFKSEALDIALIRHARYFIGTTSGLANVAISFGIPTAQVNCLTTEFQPWNSRVRFCPKLIRKKDGSLLTQRELLSDQRWALATAQTMLAAGLTAEDNSADEILAIVQEIDALAAGTSTSVDPIIATWRKHLPVKHAYGAAIPSHYFLHKHADIFLSSGAR